MSKVYIVPEQTVVNNLIVNVNWVENKTGVKAVVNGDEYDATWVTGEVGSPIGPGYWAGDQQQGPGSVTFPGTFCFYTYVEEETRYYEFSSYESDAPSSYVVSLYYNEDPVDPDAPKPDNIEYNTASRNVVIEADGPAQTRSSLNWMDRLERIIIDKHLRVEEVDEKARSVEKYLDAIQGRKNLAPIIRKTKDIDRPESDSQDDNAEEIMT